MEGERGERDRQTRGRDQTKVGLMHIRGPNHRPKEGFATRVQRAQRWLSCLVYFQQVGVLYSGFAQGCNKRTNKLSNFQLIYLLYSTYIQSKQSQRVFQASKTKRCSTDYHKNYEKQQLWRMRSWALLRAIAVNMQHLALHITETLSLFIKLQTDRKLKSLSAEYLWVLGCWVCPDCVSISK